MESSKHTLLTGKIREVLSSQPYSSMPCSVQSILLSESIKPTSYKLYVFLYSESQKNFFTQGNNAPVIISIKKLCLALSRGQTSIKGAICELREKGWLIVKERFAPGTGSQLSSEYWVSIPKTFEEQIFNAKPRARMLERTVIKKVKSTEPIDNEVSDGKLYVKDDCLLKRYKEFVREHKKQGITLLKITQLRTKHFSKDELFKIDKISVQRLDNEKTVYNTSPGQFKAHRGGKKPNTYQYNNNQYSYVNKDPYGSTAQQNSKVLSKDEQLLIFEEVKNRIQKLINENLLPNCILENGKRISDIIDEIMFHVSTNTSHKVCSQEHAMNAALNLVKSGSWRTPRKLKYQRYQASLELERKNKLEKESMLKLSRESGLKNISQFFSEVEC